MEFIHSDLGNLEKGRVVEVVLKGNAANVQLLDDANFNNYIKSKPYHYLGGLAKKSPIRYTIPHAGHWHVAIDMRGLGGTVNAQVKVLSTAFKTIKKQMPPSSMPPVADDREVNTDSNVDNEPEYDVFIAYVAEDREEIAVPLANFLEEKGIKVSYDEFEMNEVDDLCSKVDTGLANSRFGIVVISKDFIKKGWSNDEVEGMIAKSETEEQIILPVWHNITKKEIIDFSPNLADKIARNTAVNTVEEISAEIADLIIK